MGLAFANDVFGRCLYAYHNGDRDAAVTVHAYEFEDDAIPGSYLLRKQLPIWEQQAMKLCNKKVLDVGACGGVHAKILMEKGHDVMCLDLDPKACQFQKEIMDLPHAVCGDIWDYSSERKFDSILLLMNGIGLAGKLHRVSDFLLKCASLLSPGGNMLLESSDIAYLFDEVDRKSQPYYGEMQYQVSFEEHVSDGFAWLYLDPETLKEICFTLGLGVKIQYKGKDHNYLAEITKP